MTAPGGSLLPGTDPHRYLGPGDSSVSLLRSSRRAERFLTSVEAAKPHGSPDEGRRAQLHVEAERCCVESGTGLDLRECVISLAQEAK